MTGGEKETPVVELEVELAVWLLVQLANVPSKVGLVLGDLAFTLPPEALSLALEGEGDPACVLLF